jgi:hypothetical protein
MNEALPDRTDDVFLKELLDSVNAFRARHGAPPLTLDQDLVTNARARAKVVSTYDGLDEDHRGATEGIGENLSWQATGSDQPASTVDACAGWYGEIIDYDFAGAKGFDPDKYATGHFTQLVWKGSTKFGAARAFGKKSESATMYETYIVANFSPAGNLPSAHAANVLAPTAGQSVDATLRWTSFNGTTWSQDTLLAGESATGPAVASYNPFGLANLYCAHRGNDDANLWYTTWANDVKFPGMSDHGPALAVFQNKLHCVHRGTNDRRIWHTSYDGMAWAEDKVTNSQTEAAPALATFQNKLYCVHRGGGDLGLWFKTFDGTAWTDGTRISTYQSSTAPGLAVYKDKLYCAHRGGDDANVWWTAFDGTSWGPDNKLTQVSTQSGPALAVFQDKLYLVFRATDDTLRYTTFDGTSWTAVSTIPGAKSTAHPALAVHHDRMYCVHRK